VLAIPCGPSRRSVTLLFVGAFGRCSFMVQGAWGRSARRTFPSSLRIRCGDSCRASATSVACCSPARYGLHRGGIRTRTSYAVAMAVTAATVFLMAAVATALARAAGRPSWLVWRDSRRDRGFLRTRNNRPCWNRARNWLPLTADNFALDLRAGVSPCRPGTARATWTRRVIGIQEATSARLEVTVERFPRREGQLFLLDLARRAGADLGRRSARLVFRERFRLLLRRQFPGVEAGRVERRAEPGIQPLPAFPRAFLRHGQHGWAAIACPPEARRGRGFFRSA